jgi:O-antigen/teichoic acid export membrane protein
MNIHSAYSFTFLTAVMNKVPSLVAAMILTRAFSPETMGYYFVFSAICFLILIPTTFGTHQFLVRGVAKAPDNGLDLLRDVLALKLSLTLVALGLLNLGVAIAAPSRLLIMAPISLFVLAGDFSTSFGAFITGQRAFLLRFLVSLPGPIVLVSSVPLIVGAGATLSTTLLCFVASSSVAVMVGWATVRLKYGRFSMGSVDFSGIRRLLILCSPFVGLEILQVIQFKADVLMVFWIISSEAAAQYETAYRLLEVSRIVARPLATSALPICAFLIAQGDWTAARSRARQAVLYAALLGFVPMAMGLIAPEWIMTFVWGAAYEQGAGILRVLLLGTPLVYVVLIGVMLTIVLEREIALIKIMCAAAVFNILLNALVIPTWGGTGAAWTTLATETLIVIGLLLVLRNSEFAAPSRGSEAEG